jgi:diphthine synthase
MLILAGLGLFDEKDLTIREIEEAKKANKVFIELYTSKWHGSLQKLEEMIGKKIEILTRKDLEENSDKVLRQAKTQDIIIFVPGDPMIATTHTSLIQQARKLGIKTKIVHNASIISAIGETGLHIYKFGPSVTIPFPEKTKGKLPESVYDVIKMNRARGLHTLCLLDVTDEKVMEPKEAIEILLNLENARKENVIKEDLGIVIFSKAGSEEAKIVFDSIKNLRGKNFDVPAVLIIPGILHFTEREFLSTFV